MSRTVLVRRYQREGKRIGERVCRHRCQVREVTGLKNVLSGRGGLLGAVVNA